MRHATELVDEFIEGFFAGHIVSRLHEKEYLTLLCTMGEDWVNGMRTDVETLTEKLIPQYRVAQGEERAALANQIFDAVVFLRAVGAILNNPASLNELDFLRRENRELKEKVQDLAAKLVMLTPPPDRGIGAG